MLAEEEPKAALNPAFASRSKEDGKGNDDEEDDDDDDDDEAEVDAEPLISKAELNPSKPDGIEEDEDDELTEAGAGGGGGAVAGDAVVDDDDDAKNRWTQADTTALREVLGTLNGGASSVLNARSRKASK